MSERKVGTTSTTPGKPGGLQPLRQRQHQPAQARVDAVAELHHQGGVAAGEKAGLGGGWHGSTSASVALAVACGAPHHCMVFL